MTNHAASMNGSTVKFDEHINCLPEETVFLKPFLDMNAGKKIVMFTAYK